jgi:hypothetical protein
MAIYGTIYMYGHYGNGNSVTIYGHILWYGMTIYGAHIVYIIHFANNQGRSSIIF